MWLFQDITWSLFLFLLSLNMAPATITTTGSKNILFYFGLGSHSHRTSIEPLAHKLVEEGHHVTFMSPISPTRANPKFVEFCPQELLEFYKIVVETIADQFFSLRLASKWANVVPSAKWIGDLEDISCRLMFNSLEFKSWLSTAKIDLVILDHSGNKCAYALAYKFKVPTILSFALGPMTHEEDIVGIPVEAHWLPNFVSSNVFTGEWTFFDKLNTILYRLYSYLYTNYWTLPSTDKLVRQVLNLPNMPPIQELEKNTSLVFMNQHFSSDYPRALPPHVIQTGGMHCAEKPNPLPKNLQDFIDGAGEDGFIFFSLGTLVSMSRVPDWFTEILFDAVGRTKTRFLWKWDGELPSNLPGNVLAQKWFPQQDLLASKSIRAFVTHGGLMSIQQGICHGVPMIVIPVTFDQPYNARTVVNHGAGLHVELSEIKDNFYNALQTILNDKKYTENIKLLAQKFKDRPLSPLDTAYYWVNYLLRYGDVSDMRPVKSLEQTWWQRRLLDVWAFIFSLVLIFVYFFVKLILFIFRLYQSRTITAKVKKN